MMRFGGMLNQETLKPRNLGETLARLGSYFSRFWYMILLAVVFVIFATWTQVTTPELMGQATDCFLVPTGASAFGNFGSFGPASESASQAQTSSCWLTTDDPSSLTLTRKLIYNSFHANG
jgi:ATP-binding cassette subfamily B protein